MKRKLRPSLNRRRLQLESLERREVLAGNVIASVIGTTLVLTGDNSDNSLAVISLGNNRFAVAGANTTINGSTNTYAPTRTITSISANLGGGNDNLGLSNSAQGLDNLAAAAGFDFEAAIGMTVAQLQTKINAATNVTTFALAGNLTVQGGAGNDLIGLVGNVGGNTYVDLGAGDARTGNFFGIDGDALPAGFATVGPVTVVGGAQNDTVGINATDVRGNVLANLGSGNNVLDIADSDILLGGVSYSSGAGNDFFTLDSSTVFASVSLALGDGANDVFMSDSTIGALNILTGSGNDEIDTANLDVLTSASVNTGSGTDGIFLHEHGNGGTNVAGALTILTGNGVKEVEVSGDIGALSITTGASDDSVDVYDSTIGSVMINTWGGNDDVTLDNVEASVINVQLGDGNDSLDVATLVALSAVLNAGAGNDVVTIDDATVGSFSASLGAGDDVITITNSDANVATLDGGLGFDTLNFDAATVAAVDHIFRFNFELEQIL